LKRRERSEHREKRGETFLLLSVFAALSAFQKKLTFKGHLINPVQDDPHPIPLMQNPIRAQPGDAAGVRVAFRGPGF
jgi:hypothetical protein